MSGRFEEAMPAARKRRRWVGVALSRTAISERAAPTSEWVMLSKGPSLSEPRLNPFGPAQAGLSHTMPPPFS
jgi:hypothetical protein